jgi:hypothetical protein
MHSVWWTFFHAGEYPSFWISVAVGAFAHELGHLFTALVLGVRVKQIGCCWLGPYIKREDAAPMQNIAIALSGPAVNFLLGFVGLFGMPMFAAVNLAIAFINLLPNVRSSDGHRVVINLKRAMLWGETE